MKPILRRDTWVSLNGSPPRGQSWAYSTCTRMWTRCDSCDSHSLLENCVHSWKQGRRPSGAYRMPGTHGRGIGSKKHYQVIQIDMNKLSQTLCLGHDSCQPGEEAVMFRLGCLSHDKPPAIGINRLKVLLGYSALAALRCASEVQPSCMSRRQS